MNASGNSEESAKIISQLEGNATVKRIFLFRHTELFVRILKRCDLRSTVNYFGKFLEKDLHLLLGV